MESLLGEEEVLSSQTAITTEIGHNFWSGFWIAINVFHEFPEPVFLEVPMESLRVEEEVLSHQTGITAKIGFNFWSDRWIALNVLH